MRRVFTMERGSRIFCGVHEDYSELEASFMGLGMSNGDVEAQIAANYVMLKNEICLLFKWFYRYDNAFQRMF